MYDEERNVRVRRGERGRRAHSVYFVHNEQVRECEERPHQQYCGHSSHDHLHSHDDRLDNTHYNGNSPQSYRREYYH
ncbi:hypothetical protein RR46_05991 [Papilio xuthus]|uniref:Uncharacterized protein n=1 Tax=Papilio xuthus TaxID=66420 RepID=A0A194Q9K3_PAPXU|nr:hypothetical protein RR46_05991 [Papilio xuthus]